MMTLLVDALAAYRLTRLVVEDEITDQFREAIQRRLAGRDYDRLIYLLSCYWCSGFWISLAVLWARRATPRRWDPAARALAVSALVGLIHERSSDAG